MMFWGIFRFELRYQLRRYWPWLAFIAVFAIVFLTTKDAPVDDATFSATWLNSSYTAAMNTVIGCLVWLLVAAPIAGEAAARDAATRMQPLTYTAPVSKFEYLGGRFLAAFALNVLVILGVTAALLLAAYRPGVPAAWVGPFRLAAYAYPFLIIAVPNVFLTTSVQFAIATFSRRPFAAYLGSLLVFFTAYVVGLIVSFALRNPELSKVLDPIGPFFIFNELPERWTATEKNVRLLTLDGALLYNRLMWSSIGAGVLALTYARFRFAHHVARKAWWRRTARPMHVQGDVQRGRVNETARGVLTGPIVNTVDMVNAIVVPGKVHVQQFSLSAHIRQALAIARQSLSMVVRMRGGLDVLLILAVLVVVIQPINLEVAGVPIVPRTERILRDLTTPLTNFATPFVLIPLLIVYWAGELVWRERDAGLGEINDATPVPQWVMFSGKLMGLSLMLLAYMSLLVTAGILVQVRMGQRDLDLAQYVQVMFGLQFTEYLLFAVLAFVVHVIANQKYLGHLLAVVIFGLIALTPLIGVDHRMLVFSASPAWSYTQMRGYGGTVTPWLWFKLYWALWTSVLGIGALLMWSRGKEGDLRTRMRLARARMTRPVLAVGSTTVLLLLTVGGFVFYNTNVLHRYVSRDEDDSIRAEYEQDYARYLRAPQPRVQDTRLRVELYPEQHVADVQGTYLLVNGTDVAIDTIMIAPSPSVRMSSLSFDQTATRVVDDSAHFTQIYSLAQPLQPGDSLHVTFTLRFATTGFNNNGVSTTVLHNGTQIKLSDWLPGIGYQSSRELLAPRDRTKYGLAGRPVIPVLEDEAARYHIGERSMFDAIVGTSSGQIAVAPGALLRSWSENSRRYFHYRTDAPIGGEIPVLSAAYAVHHETFRPADGGKPIDIRINYHPAHAAIVDNVLRGVRGTLDYGTKNYGAYPYGHVTVSERSAGGMGLNAESGNIDYSEQFTMLAPEKNADAIDFPAAAVSHEMGHNFGVPISAVEGAPVMSESFAWYTAIGVIEQVYGREHLARMMTWMHEPYPHQPVKTGAPLIRALDPWSGYRRGPFALFALREYIGAGKVDSAIRKLREIHFAPGAPPATTLDLYRELKAVTPDSMQYLLHDLFAANTFWDLGVVGSAKPAQGGGTWTVTLTIKARKFTVDSAGKETDVPMNELVDVGVFGSPKLSAPTDPLYFQKRLIHTGTQTITLTVPRKPARVGVDPYLLLLDLDSNDNWEGIRIDK